MSGNRQADRNRHEVERDREANARATAEAEFLAREIAAIRMSLERKAERDDLVQPLERLMHGLDSLTAREG